MISEKLFDDFIRTYDDVSNHMESTFSFLDRSSRPASGRVRNILNKWYANYPTEHRSMLYKNRREKLPDIFFELLLHELLLKLEYRVKIHPNLTSDKNTHPDFYAKDIYGNDVFLEAALITNESVEEKGRNRVLAALYDQINQLKIPDYFLSIERIHNPQGKQPSGKKLKQFIQNCVQVLDYESILILEKNNATHLIPNWKYKENDLEIDFSFIPVSRENRGGMDRKPIGIYPVETKWGNYSSALCSKITKKGNKYGRLNSPFVVAINYLGGLVHKRDELLALFGTEEITFSNSSKELLLNENVNTPGVWYGPKGPSNKRISGVIITKVYPWNLAKAEIIFYHNPWATFPYKGQLTKFPQIIFLNNKLNFIPGITYGEVLSLEHDWPGELFDN